MAAPFQADDKIREDNIINESQRDSSTPGNDVGKLVQLEGDGRLHSAFLKEVVNLGVAEDINGSTSPQAVTYVGEDGKVVQADADADYREQFYGFLKENVAADFPSYLSSTGSTDPSFSYELPAGNNRLVILVINYQEQNFAGVTMPSAVSWNGQAMTKLGTTQSNVGPNNQHHDVWYYMAGDSVVPQNGAFILTDYSAGVNSADTFIALGYENVSQSNPIDIFDKSGTNEPVSVDLSAARSLLITTAAQSGTSISLASGFVARETLITGVGRNLIVGEIEEISARTVSYDHGVDVSTLFVLNSTPDNPTYEIQTRGTLGGFSALTPGKPVYLSNTAGAITQNNDEGQPIGIAYSAGEILIEKPRQRLVGVLSKSSGGTYRVSLGFRPNIIRAQGGNPNSSDGMSQGYWSNGKYAGYGTNGSSSSTSFTDGILKYFDGAVRTVTVTSVDETGFSFVTEAGIELTFEAEE